MKISVVVPAFNEERLLTASLTSIRAAMEGFARIGWESELIVCDNNSTDPPAEIAKGAGGLCGAGEPDRPGAQCGRRPRARRLDLLRGRRLQSRRGAFSGSGGFAQLRALSRRREHRPLRGPASQ